MGVTMESITYKLITQLTVHIELISTDLLLENLY
jgi:hypothetical protein